MPDPDVFEFELRLSHWLFTVAMGIPVGLVVIGLWRLFRGSGEERRGAAATAAAGAILAAAIVLLVWDVSPIDRVFFRLRPYLAVAAPGALLSLAAAIGLGAVLAVFLAFARFVRPHLRLPLTVAVSTLLVAGLLWRVESHERPDRPRHPAGTERALLPATQVLSGLNIPTGLALAPNGDLAVVELQTAGFRLYVPDADGFRERVGTRLPVAEGLQGFHVVFHPEYPEQPFVFVTAEELAGEERRLQLLRGRISGVSVEWTTMVAGLPNAQAQFGGDHHGSGLTVCDGHVFVTTGDTEVGADFAARLYDPKVIRDEAQDLGSLRGKVLRWRLSGADLVEAPAIDTGLPIYAYGFRNPFAAACDTSTGLPVVVENGPIGSDQVRVVPPRSNHEWPLSFTRDNLAEPLFDSGRVGIAPTGIAIRAHGDGLDVLMTTFVSSALYSIAMPPAGPAGPPTLLAETDGGLFGVAADERGCVYFSDTHSVWRLDDGRCER